MQYKRDKWQERVNDMILNGIAMIVVMDDSEYWLDGFAGYLISKYEKIDLRDGCIIDLCSPYSKTK